jgi:hypothetical protein
MMPNSELQRMIKTCKEYNNHLREWFLKKAVGKTFLSFFLKTRLKAEPTNGQLVVMAM